MSSPIWTQCAGKSRTSPLEFKAVRVTEDQGHISTRKLVDSVYEQEVLEDLLEETKPAIPKGPGFEGLDFLLFTPFRYPPRVNGSRFRSRWDPGVWYGSDCAATALAEIAFYRLLFLEDTKADLGMIQAGFTSFEVPINAERGIDLSSPPFDSYENRISSKITYAISQPLARSMRADQVQAFLFTSARTFGAKNVGVFDPQAFAAKSPDHREHWRGLITRQTVEFVVSTLGLHPLVFDRKGFEVNGQLVLPQAA